MSYYETILFGLQGASPAPALKTTHRDSSALSSQKPQQLFLWHFPGFRS